MIINKEIERLFVDHKNYLDTITNDAANIKLKYGENSRLYKDLQTRALFVEQFHDQIIDLLTDAEGLIKVLNNEIKIHKMINTTLTASIPVNVSARLLGLPEDIADMLVKNPSDLSENEREGLQL